MNAITVSNLKGGVGKTTIVINLGAVLAKNGYRVLLVDTDTQGHISVSFRLKHSAGLWEFMVDGAKLKDVIYEVGEGLYVIPSDRRTVAIEELLVSARNRQAVLAKRLAGLKDYDFVFLDTGPSLSLLWQNAIYFSHNILIPVAMDYFAVLGATQSLDFFRMLQRETGLSCNVLGVVPTFVDRRTTITDTILSHIDHVFRRHGIRVFSPIRIDANVRKASAQHVTVLDYKNSSRSAGDFRQLAVEILECFG